MSELRSLLTQAGELTKPDRTQEERTALQTALKELRATVEELAPGHATRHSEGQTIPADIPWVLAFPKDSTETDPQSGYYVVYLIASDGKYVNLCLGLGTTRVSSTGALSARATALRRFCADSADLELAPKLTKQGGRAGSYTKGTVVAKVYDVADMPTDEEFQKDLARFLGYLDAAYMAGLRFHATFEPVHLVYPWIDDLTGLGIVKTRKAIADDKGAAWWVTNTQIAAKKLEEMREQLGKDLETYVYLYAPGDSWRTRLVGLTTSSAEVALEPELLAPDLAPIEGGLSMKLADFQPMPTDWAGEGLFSVTNGTRVEQSFAGKPNFMYAYSGVPHQLSASIAVAPTTTKSTEGAGSGGVTEQLTKLASDSGIALGWLREMHDVLQSKQPQLILAGPPGTGKTWLAKRLAQIGSTAAAASYDLVQFHPSYSYEDFIEGLRPVAKDGTIVFQNEPGHLLKLVRGLPNGPSTLIIDEMNRANIPSVFGELMYLLEYRDERVRLRLSGEFRLPAEVRFIATMNTADRSIRSVDAALRRRFQYFEVFPDPEALKNYYKGAAQLDVSDLLSGFEELNRRLEAAIDRHHGIGHSFFMRDELDSKALKGIWTRQVRPLIEEYFFDEPHRVEAEFSLVELWPSQAE